MKLLTVACVVCGLAADRADAQPALAPLQCFVATAQGYGLADAMAQQLCIGAPSAAPAACFDAAMETGMTDYQGVQLCTGATSLQPVACVRRLAETAGVTTAQTVAYCAALPWPQVYSPTVGSPACVDAAQATGLVDVQALDVCRGSTSTAPAVCVARGRDLTGLSDADLVALCTTVLPAPQPEQPKY